MNERVFNVGDTVRVLSNVKQQKGQVVRVLRFEPDSYHRRETGDWYLLDTTYQGKWSYPCWYRAREFEPGESEARQ